MAAGRNTANFTTRTNSGVQVAQNFGVVHNGPLHLHARDAKDEQGEDGRLSMTSAKEKCHQLFRLTANWSGEGYEWYKNRIEERVQGTCEWFLSHENYRSWKQRASGVLLVSADPGCGKSVLAKFLVENELPGTVCYFFFKDQDQNTLKQALCAILHQLFDQHPSLITCALPEFRKNGSKLVEISDCLWNILRRAIRAFETITFVLDGLDECNDSDLRDLTQKLKKQFTSDVPASGGGKFLLTTRPYQDVISEFWELVSVFPGIRIPGEKFSKEISDEVSHVVRHRVDKLAKRLNMRTKLRSHLEQRLSTIPHRTYLWVYLIFDYLERGFTKTKKGVEDAIDALPENINEAYEKILERSKDEKYVRRALSVILAATRPLKLMELNIAVNLLTECSSLESLDLEEQDDFQNTLRDMCGLFVSVQNSKVYLIHQTARDFLLPKFTTPHRSTAQRWHWCGSFNLQEAHALLARLCLSYLNLPEWKAYTSRRLQREIITRANLGQQSRYEDFSGLPVDFWQYSAVNWPVHLQTAGLHIDDDITALTLQILTPRPPETPLWYDIYREKVSYRGRIHLPPEFFPLMVASSLKLKMITEKLCVTESLDQRDTFQKNALHYAADLGDTAITQVLLGNGIDINCRDAHGQTPLMVAVKSPNISVLLYLLDAGADTKARDSNGASALHHAAASSNEKVLPLLLDHGSDLNLRDNSGQTGLHYAASGGNESAVQLLLEREAEINAQDGNRRTALYHAVVSNRESLARYLLEHRAETDIPDSDGKFVLHWAVEYQHEGITQLLLDRQADVNEIDNEGQTVLHYAVDMGDLALTQLLLDYGVQSDSQDYEGRSALHLATEIGDAGIVQALLDSGADPDSLDNFGSTALHYAVGAEDEAIVELLVKNGANSDIIGGDGQTALELAMDGHEPDAIMAMGYGKIVRLLFYGRKDVTIDNLGDDYEDHWEHLRRTRDEMDMDEDHLILLAEEYFNSQRDEYLMSEQD